MQAPDNIPSVGARIARLCASAALLLLAVILLSLSVLSLFATTDMHIDNPPREGVRYLSDSLPLNLAALLLSLGLLLPIGRLLRPLPTKGVCAVCLSVVALLGIVWVHTVQGVPMQDSAIVTRAAYHLSLGDPSQVTTDYFLRCPYQLGYVLFCEILLRLFPTGGSLMLLQYVNVLCLVAADAALLHCVRLTYGRGRENVTKLSALLLTLFLPPILFCTFTYGVIPALLFSALSMWQFLELRREDGVAARIRHLLLCALFLGVAVCLKKNSIIFLCAILIIGLLRLVKEKDPLLPLCLALCLASSIGLPKAVQWQYEARTDFAFGKGVPMQAWAAMGTHDSYIAPGWYESKYVVRDFYTAGKDTEAMKPLAQQAIDEHVAAFSRDPAYALSFFSEKIASQWNEPTYQGIWLAQVRGRYGDGSGPLGTWVCGAGEGHVTQYLNLLQQLLLVLASVGAISLIKGGRATHALLPTVFLGGFLYHLLFEAKSQYCMIYILLLLPLSALGAELLLGKLERGFAAWRQRRTQAASRENTDEA